MKQNVNLKIFHADQKGFALVELIIALSVGLLLFAGVITIFIGMRATTAITSSYGELQENGRFAITVLSTDLQMQSFWGDYSDDFNDKITIPAPAIAVVNDCVGGGLNNATLPQGPFTFRMLWGQTIVAGGNQNPLGCFGAVANTQTQLNSDVIQFKRASSQPTLVNALVANNIYLYANSDGGTIFSNNAIPPFIANGRFWQYQHNVYYVRDRIIGNNIVPVLMQGNLVNGGMNFTPIIDGIEMIRFMYGIDGDGDGNVDSYLNAAAVPDNAWNNTGDSSILAIKIFVLARNIRPDRNYNNTNTYQLGDFAFTPDDNFRRLLFSSTVSLFNAREDIF